MYKNSYLCCEKLLENYYGDDLFLIPRVVITGEPNVGKSTILNRLVGEDRAIVNSKKGTTRDSIDVHLYINKTQVILVDTAGIRSSEDEIEVEVGGESMDSVSFGESSGFLSMSGGGGVLGRSSQEKEDELSMSTSIVADSMDLSVQNSRALDEYDFVEKVEKPEN